MIIKESEPQTSAPLIRPTDSDFGGAGREEEQSKDLVTRELIHAKSFLQGYQFQAGGLLSWPQLSTPVVTVL